MTATIINRGRVLSRQQVRFSDAPVKLATSAASACSSQPSGVSITTDPVTGDVVSIHVRCGCGDVTVLELDYGTSAAAGSVNSDH